MRTPSPPDPPRRIAIVRLSAIGDVVMAMPAVAALKRAFPAAHVTWIVERAARSLVERAPFVDAILEFPKHEWRAQWRRPLGRLRSVPSMLEFLRRVRREAFDLAVDFQGNIKSGICTRATGARIRLGYARGESPEPNWLATNLRRRVGSPIHRVDRDLLLVSLLNVPPKFERLVLAYRAEDRAPIDALGLERPSTVLLQPGSSSFMPHKRWPLTHYGALASRLASLGWRVLVGHGPGDEDLVRDIRFASGGHAEPAPTGLSLASLGYLTQSVGFVIGGDTGPVHLASLQGTPTYTLLGPSDARLYYPYGHPERAIVQRLPCAPCRWRGCPTRACLEQISPQWVVDGPLRGITQSAPTRTSVRKPSHDNP